MPGSVVDMLRLRADRVARTRSFFAARDVLEVDTPILGRRRRRWRRTIDPMPVSRTARTSDAGRGSPAIC